jgi:hypothetical protein
LKQLAEERQDIDHGIYERIAQERRERVDAENAARAKLQELEHNLDEKRSRETAESLGPERMALFLFVVGLALSTIGNVYGCPAI